MTSHISQLVSTGIKRFNTIDKTTDTKYDNDYLFEQLGDLTNTQYRAWYCREFFRLGKDEVLKLAAQARQDGKNPPRLFSSLLKNHA